MAPDAGTQTVPRPRATALLISGGVVIVALLAVLAFVVASGGSSSNAASAPSAPSSPSSSSSPSVSDIYQHVGPSAAVIRPQKATSVLIDENALRQVAAITSGRYYRAVDAGQLDSALRDLPSTITVAHRRSDIAARFAAVGGPLVALAIGLSLWWNRVRRVPGAA